MVVGLVTGFFLGRISVPEEKTYEDPTDGIITQTVYDTIVKTKKIEVPVEVAIDTLETVSDTVVTDTISDQIQPPDSLYEDLPIRTEKLIASKWLKVNVLEEEEEDSLVNEMMGFENKKLTKMLVEFWESPLNFSGYKLSKSKLVLYDLPANLEYKLYRKNETYYLATSSIYYVLRESEEFLPYKEVAKEVVFND